MTTVQELLEEPRTITLPRPKERQKKRRPPVVIRYIFVKGESKAPSYYFLKKADAELRGIIDEMLVGKDDMVMGDRNIHIVGNDAIVYRGIYTTTKF